MKKNMPLEGLRWSRDSGSALCDTSQNSRSRTGWGGKGHLGKKNCIFSVSQKFHCVKIIILFSIILSPYNLP